MVSEVKISWRRYKITEGEHRAGKNGVDLYGEIDYEENKIYIYDKLDEDNKKVILIHEIIHGIGYFTGNSPIRDDENIINALAENLYQIIKDNPELMKYLAGSDKNVT